VGSTPGHPKELGLILQAFPACQLHFNSEFVTGLSPSQKVLTFNPCAVRVRFHGDASVIEDYLAPCSPERDTGSTADLRGWPGAARCPIRPEAQRRPSKAG